MVKIVTVVGATGAQGKGVVRAFLNNPAYHVRAITRNPSGAAGQALASQGAEVVSADLNDLARLQTAFAGSHIIFGVTNFFEPFGAHQSATKAMERYIWSTLPNASRVSAGKYLVPHIESKNRRLQFGSYSADTPLENIGDVSLNLAPFVRAIVEDEHCGKTANGAIVLASSERLSAEELLQLWARVKGVKPKFVRVSNEDFNAIWHLWAEQIGLMMGFWDELRDIAWTEPNGQKVLTKEDLGVQGLQTLEEAYKTFEL
ncbi:hypothetical protein C8A03DRAFT_47782 [Achaetomium macrosporum]|uniref:NmrA-like domain-containing protein n=1 Tax=Achaetomium macrosporum TaxID=79813 RepID=A0AAN7H7C4_9PEZI|nr:hypothetical protein C8A03DRAFT_47782 [Achaetomium macrosporum]